MVSSWRQEPELVTEATICVMKCFSESERSEWMEEQIRECLQSDHPILIVYQRLTALLTQFSTLVPTSSPISLLISDCLPFVLQTDVTCTSQQMDMTCTSQQKQGNISCIQWTACVKQLIRILLPSASNHLQPLLNQAIVFVSKGCDNSLAVIQELVLSCNFYHMWFFPFYIIRSQFSPIHQMIQHLSQSILPSCDKENGFCNSASMFSCFLQLLKHGIQMLDLVEDLQLELLIQLCISALCSFQKQLIRDVSSFLEMIVILNTDERVAGLVQSYSIPIIRSCVCVCFSSNH